MLAALATAPDARGASFNVADEASLRSAIFTANTNGDASNTITFTGDITLTRSLPMITASLTVVGGGNTIDADNAGRVFFVQAGTARISDVTVENARAQGGSGGAADGAFGAGGGGGGGLGAGAAVFVNSGATVSLSNVSLRNAVAAGGAGGNGASAGGSGRGGGGGGLGGDGGGNSGGGGGYAGNGGDNQGGGGGEFGDGGDGGGGGGAGGGGGQRGDGGDSSNGGGGGGGGATADGGDGDPGTGGTGGGAEGGSGGATGADGGDAAASLGGGGGAGGGGGGGDGALSGGGGGAAGLNDAAGDGGTGGGGGGGTSVSGNGNGGDFGGGGGSTGGSDADGGGGGFGGGGGGSSAGSGGGGAGGYGAGGGGGRDGGAGGSLGGQGGSSDDADGGGGAALGGAVFVRDGGSLTLSNVTFAGTYSVTAGTTGGTGGATAGQAQGKVLFLHGSGATTLEIASGTQTLGDSDSLAGDGSLTKSGAGTLAITGANTNYLGSVTLAGGTLLLAHSSALGSASLTTTGSTVAYADGVTISTPITVASNSTRLEVASGTATQSGAITETGGSRPLEKTGAGTLVLTGAASHSGGTTISAGTLRLGAAERLSDDDALTVAGGATFDLTGFDETIGTLAGGGAVTLGTGRLTAGGSDDSSFSGTISGTGGLTKQGSGTLTLANASSFTGGTTVAAGGLVVNGTLGDLTLLAGTTLGGSGTVGAVTAAGRVSPGNSIGTLSTGPVNFQSGSVLAVEIADDGTSDKLQVAGTATVEPGASVEVTPQAGSYANGQTYTILSASGGIEGAFDTVAYAAGSTLTFDLSLLTEGNDLLLLLGRLPRRFAELVGAPALVGTASGLDALEAEDLTDGERDDPLLQALFAIEDTATLDTAVQRLSGAGIGGGAQTAQLGSQAVLQTALAAGGAQGSGAAAAGLAQLALGDAGVTDVLGYQAAAPTGQAEAQPGPAVWLQGVGGFGSRHGEGLVSGQSRHYAGIAGGVGVEIEDGVELGLTLARVEGETDSDDGLTSDDGTTLMAAVTGSWQPQATGLRLTVALGLARHDLSSERRVVFANYDETASGDHTGWEFLADLGATWDVEVGALTLSPTAGLGLAYLAEAAWSESGAGSANLAYDETETLTVLPRTGLGLAYDLQLGEGLRLTPSAQALWLGRLGDRRSQYDARFAGTGTSWAVPGLDEPANSAAVSLGVDLASHDGWQLGAGYAGRFAEGAQDHGFLLGGSLRF